MHVAMVTPLPPDPDKPRGGVEAVAVCLIRALVKAGVRVTALQWGGTQDGPHDDAALGCHVIPLRLRHPAMLANWLRTSGDVRRLVDEIRPDLVHVQDIPELGAALTGPRVLTIHGNNPRDEWLLGGIRRYVTTPIMALTFRWCRRKYRHVIMISPYSRRIGGFAADSKLHDVDNPVEDRFFDVSRQAGPPTVLMAGPLSELKNTMAVVQVAARLRRSVPDVRFRLAGAWREKNPAYRRSVEALRRSEQLEDAVQFLGLLGRAELLTELSRASCAYLPSFQENAPMVVSEAMAAGLPVVASRVGGIPWMVTEGKTGLLFDPNDIEGMSEGLRRVLSDPSLCGSMAAAARQEAERRFRASVVADKTLSVYRAAVAEESA